MRDVAFRETFDLSLVTISLPSPDCIVHAKMVAPSGGARQLFSKDRYEASLYHFFGLHPGLYTILAFDSIDLHGFALNDGKGQKSGLGISIGSHTALHSSALGCTNWEGPTPDGFDRTTVGGSNPSRGNLIPAGVTQCDAIRARARWKRWRGGR